MKRVAELQASWPLSTTVLVTKALTTSGYPHLDLHVPHHHEPPCAPATNAKEKSDNSAWTETSSLLSRWNRQLAVPCQCVLEADLEAWVTYGLFRRSMPAYNRSSDACSK
eukprot:322564-Rhodomonas_salina.2